MFDRLLDFEFALWLVAAALYVLDALRLIAPGEVLLEEGARGTLRPHVARVPFEWSGKHLYAAGLLAPARGLLRAPRQPGSSESDVAAALAALDALRARWRPLRVAAVLVFISLFVAGPLATAYVGLGIALPLAAGGAYLLALTAGLWLLVRAPQWGLPRTRAAWIAIECLVCVPFAANLVKKVAWLMPLNVDGLALARARMSDAERERLALRLNNVNEEPS
jgi:hypothetical protein